MADTRISDLTAITGANLATGDLLVAVDVSDTTMAASGTDKKITADEFRNFISPGWTAYTPTLTQSGTVTKTVTVARYLQIGKLVIVYVRLDVTGAGTTNNTITVSTPATGVSTGYICGSGEVIDASGATVTYPAMVYTNTTTTFSFGRTDQSAFVSRIGVDPNFALASGDVITFTATYEAA